MWTTLNVYKWLLKLIHSRPDKLVKATYRVMGYLVGTPHCNICYKMPAYTELQNRIYAACDASFADDRLTKKSHQGHLIFYNSGPIIWKSNRQRTIALSTTEAELDNFVSCVRSVLHTMAARPSADRRHQEYIMSQHG